MRLIKILKEITSRAWADFGETPKVWLENTEYLVLVRKGNDYIAFDAKGVLGNDFIFLSSMVWKEFQNKGIIKKASRISLKKHIVKTFFKNPLKIFKPLYFVFRTPNPILYESVVDFDPFPDILNNRKSEEKERELAIKIIELLSPGAKYDIESFVIEKALKNPDLFYSLETYPRTKNDKINDYFEKKINYSNNEGNLLIVVGKIRLKDII